MSKKINRSKLFIVFGLCALWIFSMCRARLGMHSDEVHSIAVGDMIARGDSFFKECWFYLQMSAVFSAPIIKIYNAMVGSTEGILLCFRILSILVQTIICIYFYLTFSKRFNKLYVMVASVVLFTYIPDFQSFNYKQEIIWFSVLEIIYIYRYYIGGKKKYIVLLGVAISASVLAYPTSILQFPLYIAMVYWINKEQRKNCIILAVTCCICGIVFLTNVFSEITIDEFIEFFPKVFSDDNLNSSFITKLIHPAIKFGILGIATLTPLYIVGRLKWKMPNIQYVVILILLWGAFLGQCYIERMGITWHCITYPFSLTIFMLPIVFGSDKENRITIILFEISAIVLTLVIALASNQGNITSMYSTVITTIALILMLGTKDSKYNKIILASILFFSLSMFVVPVYEQESVEADLDETARTIFTNRELVSNGPAKGLYLGEKTYPDYENICSVVEEYVGEKDKLFIVDNERMASYGYLCSVGEYATYSPQGGWGISTSYKAVRFFNDNPQKKPDIVLIRLDYIDMNIESYLSTTYVGQYLSENMYNIIGTVKGYVVLSDD